MRRSERTKREEHARRTRDVLYASEVLAAELRRELAPEGVPVIGERTHKALDLINAWVGEARALHGLAERELSLFHERRRSR